MTNPGGKIIDFARQKNVLECSKLVDSLPGEQQAVILGMLRQLQKAMNRGLCAKARRKRLLVIASKVRDYRLGNGG